MTEIKYENPNFIAHLKHSQYLAPFHEVVKNEYHPMADLCVYRSLQELPPTDDDQTPQVLRNKDEKGQAIAQVFSEEEVATMSAEKQLKQVGKYALSVNDTAETAVTKAQNDYNRLRDKRKLPKEELDDYARRRGHIVARLKLNQEVGLITDFKDGHANLLLYEGVELKDIIDYSFTPVDINYESNDD